MSVSAELGLGAALTAVFWGHIAAAILDGFGAYTGEPWPFLVSGMGFVWGYGLARVAKEGPFSSRKGLILAGWLSPIMASGIVQTLVWLKPEILPWDIALSARGPMYMILWALCSVQGINRVRLYKLVTSQRNSLLGTLLLALLASLKVSDRVNLAAGALLFALVSTLDISMVRQSRVLRPVQSGRRRYWTAGGLGFLTLVLAIAALVSMGFPGTVSLIGRFLAEAWNLLSILVIYIAVPIGLIAEWIVIRLRQLLNLEPAETQEFPPLGRDMFERLQEEGKPAELPPWAYAILIGAAIAAVLWLIWRFALKRGTSDKQSSLLKETRTSLLGRETFGDWAKSAMGQIQARIRAGLAHTLGAILPGRPRNIQELYSRSLEALGRHGVPRKQSQTPLEHAKGIPDQVTTEDGRQAFNYITELFCRCHYSNRQPDMAEWEKAVEAYSVLIQSETFRMQPPVPDYTVSRK